MYVFTFLENTELSQMVKRQAGSDEQQEAGWVGSEEADELRHGKNKVTHSGKNKVNDG